ncbi:MAG TPA: Amuc_1100 family pilus-like protein [Clostridia bacterium]|nr:Amuc_1100 family pilus-like protein [Clostridia bacterium]
MDWIKRNLYFFVGSIVAVVLMGLAGFYLYSKWQLNNEIMEKLNADHAELQRLNQENPHPGAGQVDNIKAAKEQQEALRAFDQKTRKHFQRIPAMPDSTNVSSQEFTATLRRTIDQLQKAATNASVTVPPDYSFSFTAQKPRVTFAPGSLEPLSVQLGEVHAISEVLFAAKINSLDSIRRERVSPDDSGGPQTEYLLKKSVTNELAVLSPYEVTFRCFSSELAGVLAGLGSSPYGLLLKSLNVEAAPATAASDSMGTPYTPATMYTPAPMQQTPSRAMDAEASFAQRYGLGGRGGNQGGVQLRAPGTTPAPAYQAPVYGAQAAAANASKGGFPTVLDEKQLKVTMNIDVVKLLPPK